MGRKKSSSYYYSNGNRPSSSGTQSFSPNLNVFGRNLRKDQLKGVIFGCTHSTMQECLSKQLFGLPKQHLSYVMNIEPGMPLFLFNYSDRKLHGVFEAASKGREFIDRRAWTDGSEVTQYPAQVKTCVRCRCYPLLEEKFKPIIAQNYFVHKHFWFELDHEQTNMLMSLFKPIPVSPRYSVPQNTQWLTPSSSLPSDDAWGDDEAFKMPESEFGFSEDESSANAYLEPLDTHTTEELKMPELEFGFSEDESSANAYLEPLDTHTTEELKMPESEFGLYHEEEKAKQVEMDMIFTKLKELAIPRENQDFSWEDNVSSNPDANNICVEEKHSETQLGSEKEENPSSPFNNERIIAQLEQEVKELTRFKEAQTEKNNYLEQKLMEALSEIQVIQVLKKRLALLESTCNIAHAEETVTNPSADLHLDPKDSLFLIGGFDGESSLAAMDLYSTSQNVVKSFMPMSSVRLYASAVEFNNEIYVLGGGDNNVWYDKVESYNPIHDNWALRPSLNQKKGSLAGAALNGKLFAFGGGNGIDCFSEVEMLDFDIGRWIPTRSMTEKRFSLAAVELNGVIYATGGFDGSNYLNSAERFDPREHSWNKIPCMNSKRSCHSLVALNEKLYSLGGFDGNTMVPSVEVFDPRFGTWTMAETMSHPRGYCAAAVLNDSIFVIGGVNGYNTVIDMVENYKEGRGWTEIYQSNDVKRCYLTVSTIVGLNY